MDTNNPPNNKKIIIRFFIESIYIFVKFLFFKFFIMRFIIMFPNIHTLQTQWFSWSKPCWKPWENGKNKVPLWWTKSVFGICCILILINHGFFIKLVLINSKTLEYEIGSDTWQTRRSLSLKRNYKIEIIRDPHWPVIKAYHGRVTQCKVKIMPLLFFLTKNATTQKYPFHIKKCMK